MVVTETASIDTLLASYVAGLLPPPVHALVEAHLELSDRNHRWLRDLEDVAGTLLEGEQPAPLGDAAAMLEAILERSAPAGAAADEAAMQAIERRLTPPEPGRLPRAIERFIGMDRTAIPWKTKLPGIREWSLGDRDGAQVSMFWLKANTAVPTHTHEGSELTLVLEGGFSDGIGHYVRGDISLADPTVDHRPVADADGDCIGFAVRDAPLRLTGPIGRWFAPFLR